MERAQVDALLLTDKNNIRYTTGLFEVGWIVPAYFYMAIVPRASDLPVTLVVPEGDQIQAQQSWVNEVIRWDFLPGFFTAPVGDDLVRKLSRRFHEFGLAHASIATETGPHFRARMSLEIWDELKRALPEVRWTDAGSVIWPVRSIKSTEEIRR